MEIKKRVAHGALAVAAVLALLAGVYLVGEFMGQEILETAREQIQ